MKMASSRVCSKSGFWVVFLVLLGSSCSEGQMVPAVFVFGDSLVDVGNNNYLPVSFAKADFPHNGMDFPTHKPTGRFSNGKNAADFLAEKLGLPTSPPYLALISNSSQSNSSSPFLTGVSFASAGAGIFDSIDEKFHQALTLTQQVDYFLAVHDNLVEHMGSSGAQKHVAKSLFVIVIGSNDIFGYSGSSDTRKQHTPQQYVDLMASSLKDLLKCLHSYDARKFAFSGLGPIGCCPSQRNQNKTAACKEDTNSWARMYNVALLAMLKGLKSELEDISYSYLDTHTVLQNFIQNPSAYGFTEVKAACCGLGTLNAKVACLPISEYCPNRRDHVFWDLYHPTEAAARIIIDEVFHGSPQYAYPMDLQQLAAVQA
ncbi:GDSL esterase/lipase At5g55050-like [Rhodamnia argentea]|uniref:GDSL esterase/lipase At5g55050-like n=1 Tax=Rhodamnia argentea TaxID=178133 RepID=A0A8B8Q8J4_9MYRT|nr:GDSL esterase/lipase At5g55050-like [Rhodamnia argentea]